MEAKKNMTIGELAKLAGDITHRTIRYYEELGLIKPASKTAGGRKRYASDALLALARVKILQEAGIPLNNIIELLDYLDGLATTNHIKTSACINLVNAAKRKIVQRANDLRKMIKTLDHALENKTKCQSCPSEDCAGCGRLDRWMRFGIEIPLK